jgi:hypothetical protein
MPVMFVAALALSASTVPAVATVPVEPVAVVEAVDITADAGAVLAAETVSVETVAAPVVVEPVAVPAEPVALVVPAEPVAVPAEPATAPVEPDAPATAEPTAPATDESYPAPPASYECVEDEPCWDCATMGNLICGNPICEQQFLFTVTPDGECSETPIGYTKEQVRLDALYEFNGQQEDASPVVESLFNDAYAGSSALGARVYRYIPSSRIPGVIHAFK